MDRWCFNQHTELNRRAIKIEIWCYDGMTSIDFPKSSELLTSRSYILDPKTDTSEQPHLHPNCEHHLEMVRMWERRMLGLIYCCWVIQVALASKVGYKAVDDYVKSGPLGLQGETPVSEDWRIQNQQTSPSLSVKKKTTIFLHPSEILGGSLLRHGHRLGDRLHCVSWQEC